MENILIVDDQADNRDTILGYLQNDNYKFLQAANGENACTIAESRLPDLIILDWEMPVMNGIEALGILKKNPATKDIPIIMATARSSVEDLERALDSGAADYIRKPIERHELRARVQSCMVISRHLKELKQKNEVLEILDRERNGLIDMIVHDLRNPLNVISGYNQILSAELDMNEEQKEYAHEIKRAVKKSANLINDLLELHASDNEIKQAPKQFIDIGAFIADWEKNFQDQLAKKDQKLVTNIADNISIEIDTMQLTRILDNLLTNAIKFSEKGSTIILNVNDLNEKLTISIKDEGPGISVEDQKKMFRMFQKLSAKPTDGESSTGLGLAIIKTLLDKLGGSIAVNSQLGKGSEFVISLPK